MKKLITVALGKKVINPKIEELLLKYNWNWAFTLPQKKKIKIKCEKLQQQQQKLNREETDTINKLKETNNIIINGIPKQILDIKRFCALFNHYFQKEKKRILRKSS